MRTRIFAGLSSTNHACSRQSLLVAALMLWVSLSAGTHVGAVTVEVEQPDLARKPSFSIVDGEVQLSLEDAISVALERNLSLVIERYLVEESDLAIKRSRGIYDLFGTIDMQALEDTSPTASNLEAGLGQDVQNFKRKNWNFGLDQLTPTGGTVFLDWVNQRDETNSSFATLNPAYRIDLDLSVSQPLMRNLGKMATERNITIAQTNRNISGA
ncbi:MAG: hypothetical protein P8Y44_12695, partial [Acidobacteriota bacterium]